MLLKFSINILDQLHTRQISLFGRKISSGNDTIDSIIKEFVSKYKSSNKNSKLKANFR